MNGKANNVLRKFRAVEKSHQDKGNESQQLRERQKALEDALLKNKALEKMIDIAENGLKINIRKKSGTNRSQQ